MEPFFLHEVTVTYNFKIDLNDFLGKTCFEVFVSKEDPNWTENEVF